MIRLLTIWTIFFLPCFASAQCPGSPPAGMDCVEAADQKEILAHVVCRKIINNHSSNKSLLIPKKTAAEWTSIYTTPPAGVTTAACVDPCAGKSVGQACTGTTALYAGIFDGGKYMVMPSGCADNISNPACAGIDTVSKTWNDGVIQGYDIPGITNVGPAFTPSASDQRGHITTPIVAALTLAAHGGVHAAAHFCDDMVYGGYDDWYLPSKSEMAYLYCVSTPPAHNALYPNENVNCGGAGPTNQLTGFLSGNYWVSTEYNGNNVHLQSMYNGSQSTNNKSSSRGVRCIRRYDD